MRASLLHLRGVKTTLVHPTYCTPSIYPRSMLTLGPAGSARDPINDLINSGSLLHHSSNFIE